MPYFASFQFAPEASAEVRCWSRDTTSFIDEAIAEAAGDCLAGVNNRQTRSVCASQ
jgi:hypothetical protein